MKKQQVSFHSTGLLYSLIKRIFWGIFIFWGITVISFVIIHLAPCSPTDLETTMNPLADAAAYENLQKLYGLDKPLYEQYLNWFFRLLHFDFGDSLGSDNRPVMVIIGEALPITLWLNSITLFISLLFSIPIGVLAAKNKGKLFDKITTIIVFIGFSIPSFWLSMILLLYFSLEIQWFPISGLKSFTYDNMSLWQKIFDLTHHLALPIFIGVFGSLAGYSRFIRSSVLDTLHQGFILTARAKGLHERTVIFRHALRNALLPLITLLGLSIPGLIGGSVIIETIFSIPGMGQLFYKAVMARNYPLIMGNLVIGALLTLAGNFLADLCYSIADPRIRRG